MANIGVPLWLDPSMIPQEALPGVQIGRPPQAARPRAYMPAVRGADVDVLAGYGSNPAVRQERLRQQLRARQRAEQFDPRPDTLQNMTGYVPAGSNAPELQGQGPAPDYRPDPSVAGYVPMGSNAPELQGTPMTPQPAELSFTDKATNWLQANPSTVWTLAAGLMGGRNALPQAMAGIPGAMQADQGIRSREEQRQAMSKYIGSIDDPNERAMAEAFPAQYAEAQFARSGKGGLTPAQEAVDKEYAKEYVEWSTGGGYADVQKQMGQLGDVIQQLESGERNLTGKDVAITNATGLTTFMNPEARAAQDAVEEVVQRNLRLVLGSQFTDDEGKRLIARAYNPALDEKENAKRLRRLITQIDRAAQARQSAAEYYEKRGTLVGWGGRLPTKYDIEAGIGAGGQYDAQSDPLGLFE